MQQTLLPFPKNFNIQKVKMQNNNNNNVDIFNFDLLFKDPLDSIFYSILLKYGLAQFYFVPFFSY